MDKGDYSHALKCVSKICRKCAGIGKFAARDVTLLRSQLAESHATAASLLSDLHERQSRISTLLLELADLRSEIGLLERQVSDCMGSYQSVEAENDRLRSRVAELEQERDSANLNAASSSDLWAEQCVHIARLEAQLKATTALYGKLVDHCQATEIRRGTVEAQLAGAREATVTILSAIEQYCGDEFSEDLDCRAALCPEKMDETLKQAANRLSEIYVIAHAYNTSHSCYDAHDSWRTLDTAP